MLCAFVLCTCVRECVCVCAVVELVVGGCIVAVPELALLMQDPGPPLVPFIATGLPHTQPLFMPSLRTAARRRKQSFSACVKL